MVGGEPGILEGTLTVSVNDTVDPATTEVGLKSVFINVIASVNVVVAVFVPSVAVTV